MCTAARPHRRRRSAHVAYPIAAFVAGVAAIVILSDPLAAAQRITFRADDGVALAGTWYEPSSRPAPAVILVHMLQKSRRDWDPAAARMASEGIGALAVDLRGHGESQGSAQDYGGMAQDIRAARRWLATRAEVNPSRIGIAGASLGATLAAQVAAEDPSIASLALLSPSIDYRGLRIDAPLRKFGARPALLVASDDDGYAVRSSRDLQKAGGGTRETIVLSRAGHGTAMLASDPDLARRLVEWFRRTLL
ncbi:MAG TPA: alpha/beta fold hydrolase [Vicinamibacterales bacterium]|jgi:alpha-beta hydrolase superfamily lysophospholipase